MKNNKLERKFSLKLFLLIVIGLSWPFQLVYLFGGDKYRQLLLVSMIMVAVGTYICGKVVFKDGFKQVGWRIGGVKYYFWAIGLALFLWLFPSIIEQVLGIYKPTESIKILPAMSGFLFSFVITLIPAFSEEFGWRGYLLPRLMKRHTPKKALLIHGLVTWFWHWPVLIAMAVKMDNPLMAIPMIMLISLIPTVAHAIVFAYLWSKSRSIAVATIYHTAFDEVRDTLEGSVGLGVLGQNWQMLVLSILGLVALQKNKWKEIETI